jgi:YHS domain-containing protein
MSKLKSFLIIAIVALMSNFASAQTEPVSKDHLAIGGYDVISYFTANKAAKGSEKFATIFNDVKYHFTSAKNREAFLEHPQKYLPQCDGFCAWGVAEKNTKFPINPETFKIVDGKLYLFFNGDFQGSPFNTLTVWNKEEQRLLGVLQPNWDKLQGK